MAIRLRTVGCVRVALCAVETDPQPDDLYLDDADHYALMCKFVLERDWMGLEPRRDPVVKRVMDSQKLRDAKDELEKWLAQREA